MTTKLETIGNVFDTELNCRPIPWNEPKILSNPTIQRVWSQVRKWILPAVCFPTWWTAARSSKMHLNIPEYRQPSAILHEITRRM